MCKNVKAFTCCTNYSRAISTVDHDNMNMWEPRGYAVRSELITWSRFDFLDHPLKCAVYPLLDAQNSRQNYLHNVHCVLIIIMHRCCAVCCVCVFVFQNLYLNVYQTLQNVENYSIAKPNARTYTVQHANTILLLLLLLIQVESFTIVFTETVNNWPINWSSLLLVVGATEVLLQFTFVFSLPSHNLYIYENCVVSCWAIISFHTYHNRRYVRVMCVFYPSSSSSSLVWSCRSLVIVTHRVNCVTNTPTHSMVSDCVLEFGNWDFVSNKRLENNK